MSAADLKHVLALWSSTEGVGLNESDTPEQLTDYIARNPGLSLVTRDEQRIVAAVLCGHDGRRGYLHHLAVAPEFRHRGLGRELVETCLRALAAQGIRRCNIFLFADNEPGAAFWTHCAWSPRLDLQILQRPTSA
jgi:N-acetylglutamate synthase